MGSIMFNVCVRMYFRYTLKCNDLNNVLQNTNDIQNRNKKKTETFAKKQKIWMDMYNTQQDVQK